MSLLCRILLSGTLLILSFRSSFSDEPQAHEIPSAASPSEGEEISALIRSLGDPSFEVRSRATRRLCAIGMPAVASLRKAAESDDFETALRAANILSTLDRLSFAGLKVELAVSRSTIAWDESIDLEVTLHNPTRYESRVPFDLDRISHSRPASDAEQVGTMLDIADWLKVRDEEDRDVELRVDDIGDHADVMQAVHDRLESGPSSLLPAGRRVTLRIRDFNRGWARYPFLNRGTYRVALEYVPEWEDEELRAQRIGWVASNIATITVTESAPKEVSRSGVEVALIVERRDETYAAVLTNAGDLPLFVNRNYGAILPFAQGKWVYMQDESMIEIHVPAPVRQGWNDFDAAQLVEVGAGSSIELARISAGELRRELSAAGADLTGDRWTVHFQYTNRCDRRWQSSQRDDLLNNDAVPPIFRSPLPRRILTTRQNSNPFTLPAAR